MPGFVLFADANGPVQVLQITLYKQHSDVSNKYSAAINNRHLDFIQTRSLITLANDNHVDNHLQEVLAFVYYDSIVNNLPNK